MSPLTRPRIPPGALLLGLFAAVAAAAAFLIYIEKAPAGLFGVPYDRRSGPLLGGMLASLGAVMVSLILPVRLGHVVLVAGAAMFFAILGYALLNGVQF